MDIKDTVASLQLKDTRIIKIETKNDFIELPKEEEIEHSISMGNPAFQIKKYDNMLVSTLQLKVNVTAESKSDDKKLCICVLVEGLFTFNEDDEKKFEEMLLLNGNSTLYSIARSYILTISSMSLVSGQIVLPMINFLKLAKTLEKQKEENK